MGRDIDFVGNELSSVFDYLRGSEKSRTAISYNVKTHRTGLHHSCDPYEDYGVLLWMDEDGNVKKGGKRNIMLETQSYRPKDFVKTKEVLVEVGNYGVGVASWLQGHPGRTVTVFQVVDIIANEDYNDRVRLVKQDIHTICKDYMGDISTEEIHQEFDEKFWKGVEKAVKIPKKFKKQKNYHEYYLQL